VRCDPKKWVEKKPVASAGALAQSFRELEPWSSIGFHSRAQNKNIIGALKIDTLGTCMEPFLIFYPEPRSPNNPQESRVLFPELIISPIKNLLPDYFFIMVHRGYFANF